MSTGTRRRVQGGGDSEPSAKRSRCPQASTGARRWAQGGGDSEPSAKRSREFEVSAIF